MAAYELEVCHLTGERGVTAKIKGAMQDAARQFVYIGFLLWEVKRYEYFYELNYGSVYEYAEAELGFKRSSTKNFIAICEEFCRRNDWDKNMPTMHLDSKWNDFRYSQLTEMLSMSAKQREQAKPAMTVKQLRELKRADDQTPPQAKSTGQTSGQNVQLKATPVNNHWKELDPEVVKAIVKAAGLHWDPRTCYNIKVEKHNG